MTIEKANEIFKTKYPNGMIQQKANKQYSEKYSRFFVTFELKPDYEEPLYPWDENCTETVRCNDTKWYAYGCSSYVELLNRLGFKLVYRKDIETYKHAIENIKERLAIGGNDFLTGEFIPFTDSQISSMKSEIAYYEDIINNSVIV